MVASLDENDLNHLEQTVGVRPCSAWWSACRAHLLESSRLTVDDVLVQVLHSDLRDVVRQPAALVVGSNAASISQRASQQLYQAILKSKETLQQQSSSSNPSSTLQTLPESFRLLVQVEELLDVSKIAEARLALGPAPSHHPTPIGNQLHRCLKLCVSDGYLRDQHFAIFAMEVHPIPNLSVQSPAGIKLIWHGPVQIRAGMVLLHPGNTTVLGGKVDRLVEIQTKAVQQAQARAGIGVDATVRALIGTRTIEDETATGEEDEHEGASGDVVAPVAPQAFAGTFQPVSTTTTTANPVVPSQTPVSSTIIPGSRSPAPPTRAITSPVVSSTRTTNAAIINTYAARPTRPTATNPPDQVPSPATNRNPYARSNASTPTPVRSRPLPEPFASATVGGGNVSPAPRPDSSLQTAASGSISTVSAQSQVPTSTADLTSSSREWTVDELFDLVKRCLNDRNLYRQQVDQSFKVKLQYQLPSSSNGFATANPIYFNIHKIPKTARRSKRQRGSRGDETSESGASSKKEKYEFVLVTTFGNSSSTNVIPCKLAGGLLDPFFGHSPSELRQISRTDRQKSQSLVEEGGARAREALFSLRTWQASLAFSTAEEVASLLNDSSKRAGLGGIDEWKSIDQNVIPWLQLHSFED